MNKEQLIALGLTEEQADKVIEGFGQMIPKSRFDEVNQAKKQADELLEQYKQQIEQLKQTAQGSEELQQQITDLQNQIEQTKTEYENQLKQTKIDNAIDLALTNAKAKNLKAVKALLDLDGIELDENGNVKGLEEKVKALVEGEETSFLFETTTTTLAGAQPNNQPGNNPTPPDLNNMTYSEMVEYLKNNPGAQI